MKLLEKKFQEILNLQTLINDYEKKEWSLRLKETKSLLEKLTQEKMQCVETQTNIQIEIDTIKEFIANQEVNFNSYKKNYNILSFSNKYL